MTRAAFRFRDHTIRPDTVSEPVKFAMRCKAEGCGAEGEASEDPAQGSQWAVDHLKETGHMAYREVITRAYRFEPGAWQ
ncbi:hypothetical protein [Streptomyces sp. NPDC020330]|uniref:DUF7848 domain-containing protein n=1 Tax=unclassified Streptomyces TaxID=2593676 RepID=UPI003788D07D